MKKKSKVLKFIALGIVAVIGGLVLLTMFKDHTALDISASDRAAVQKMDLDNSVSITGKGVSDQVDYVYADISAPVKEIRVHKGDYVHAGDLICTFDVADLTAQRDNYVELLADFEKYQKLKNDNYDKGFAYQKDVIQQQIAQLEDNIRTARRKYNEAVDSEQYYASWAEAAATDAEAYKAEYETVDAEVESIRMEMEIYNQTYPQNDDAAEDEEAEPAPPPPYDTEHYTDLVEHSAKMKSLYELAVGKKEYYETKRLEAKSDAESLDAAIQRYNAEYRQYKAQEASGGTMSVEIRNDLMADRKTESDYRQKIEELNKKLANSEVVAGRDGIVTEIYASVGDYTMDNAICQIQDNGKMHFEGYLNPNKSEYVTTDSRILVSLAVNNYEPLEGTIISVGDYYDAENGGYKIEFTFDGIDDMEIYPGFEAASKIIISQEKDAVVVPYDAIFEKDGKFYVRKVKSAQDAYDETEDIEITKGLETSYYVAVSSDRLNVSDVVMTGMQSE